ncbi:alpha-amylase [Mumia sp. zg.B53]|uniref:glycoside hydrolase family 13 protein n=1 Tax=Mumia sp. zg.B53 TaxID=2855449 RepID=UPI001C6E0086|nr:alpha-amylase family glycosyl hydrolase [Mumia sp. zg.B53]MBW9215811.1 alpha-amylase [Mumia sp. zg.B53]
MAIDVAPRADGPADTPVSQRDWWRDAVVYQVYPRSFADGDGDGTGDLMGIGDRLPALAGLGVDAVWLSPFYPSPQRDGGYDVSDYCDVDPAFGTLADLDRVVDVAHAHGLRVIIDLVPNHCSSDHPMFRAALAAPPDSRERARFHFRDGRGEHGELPPNDWQSHFGGSAWTRVTEPDGRPGQWYLHLFDPTQPDFNWDSEDVLTFFDEVLDFWLARGVDGFRVDVAHALVKAPGLPDWGGRADGASSPGFPGHEAPMFDQPGVHAVYERWRERLERWGPDRILCAEANVAPLERAAKWVRPREMHQAFNFAYLHAPWDAVALRRVIDESLAAFGGVGAPSTWVLSNHDVVRHATRFALVDAAHVAHGHGFRADTPLDPERGERRARAATALMLALPGAVYLYQGEELGLPEVLDIPDDQRHDPYFLRSGGAVVGRDGCRVPIPWEAHAPAYGFNGSGSSWLPQPAQWARYARDVQGAEPTSTLALYTHALATRKVLGLGAGSLRWVRADEPAVLAFVNGEVLVVANLSDHPVPAEADEIVLESVPGAVSDGLLAPDATAWFRAPAGTGLTEG